MVRTNAKYGSLDDRGSTSSDPPSDILLLAFDRCLVDQHDGNVILNGVDTAALGAFEAGAVRAQSDRFFAFGADKDVEKIGRNHDGIYCTGTRRSRLAGSLMR